MKRVRETTVDLILMALIPESGEIPWYLVDLYLYYTKKPVYSLHNAADYTKVIYDPDDNIMVMEVYFKGRKINEARTRNAYKGENKYYIDLKTVNYERNK